MANLISSQDDITVLKIKDYIQKPKDNGYRSYHMIVEIPVFFSDEVRPVRCEIQIRTIAMDFWASLDHEMRYKKEDDVPPALRDELRDCAEAAAALDVRMQEIHQKLLEKDQQPPATHIIN